MEKDKTNEDIEFARLIARKKSRKATSGGWPKLLNIPRNWLHQAITYMDTGELLVRILIEIIEILVVYILIKMSTSLSGFAVLGSSILIVHTWNWVTNCLFWVVVIQTFPNLKNPGGEKTVEYLNNMAQRLKESGCISGMAIYGSVSRGAWHDRSDIDLRILRKPGIRSLFKSSWITMVERFRAFLAAQPMDLYLADDVDFIASLRKDEIPLLLIKNDSRLDSLYPENEEMVLSLVDIQGLKI